MPSPADLRDRWEIEWNALDEFLDGLDEARLLGPYDQFRLWQTMLHVVNHGTQHRSEAAAERESAGSSPIREKTPEHDREAGDPVCGPNALHKVKVGHFAGRAAAAAACRGPGPPAGRGRPGACR